MENWLWYLLCVWMRSFRDVYVSRLWMHTGALRSWLEINVFSVSSSLSHTHTGCTAERAFSTSTFTSQLTAGLWNIKQIMEKRWASRTHLLIVFIIFTVYSIIVMRMSPILLFNLVVYTKHDMTWQKHLNTRHSFKYQQLHSQSNYNGYNLINAYNLLKVHIGW